MTRSRALMILNRKVAAHMAPLYPWPRLNVQVTLVPHRLLLEAIVLVTWLKMKRIGLAMHARWLRSLRTWAWKCNATWHFRFSLVFWYGSGSIRSGDFWVDGSNFLSANWNMVLFSDEVVACSSYVDSVSSPFCANDLDSFKLLWSNCSVCTQYSTSCFCF